MDGIRHWTEILLESYTKLVDGLIYALPRVVAGTLLFFFGWLLARFISWLIERSLRALRFDKLMERIKVGDSLRRVKLEGTPSQVVGKFAYWLIMLLIIVGFAEALELRVVSQKIGVLINYIPNIVLASFILVIGMFLADKVKELFR